MKVYDVATAEFAQRFAEIEAKRPEALARGLRSAAAIGALIIAKAAPVGVTGLLKMSAHAEYPGNKGAMIVVDAPYAGIVEAGSRPHMPPLGPLLLWVEKKLGIDAAAAMGVARAIQMKIAREGTAPQWFVKKRLPLLRKILKAEVEAELRRSG